MFKPNVTPQTSHSDDARRLKERLRHELKFLRIRLIGHAVLILLGEGLIEAPVIEISEKSAGMVVHIITSIVAFGVLALLTLYVFVIGRGLYIAIQAQDTFSRLLAGSISLTFFVYVFVNTGMVTGLLPVVGVPLPLVSYGGTSMVTLMAGFGILMSIHSHRKLLPH